MKESNERIQYIADYISAYEEKIKLLNTKGLFDSATLFELFAIEVGSLYFGQQFRNLNINKYTYPCVDLISTDEKIVIQVSTTKNIPSKIKKTLEHIKNSDRPEINSLKNVKFFVLNNESVDKVKNYTGNAQIGEIPFDKENDLITTRDILEKATTNLEFQIALYELLKKEYESIKDNLQEFQKTIEISKSVGLGNIDCKINNEYEIDREELISRIQEDDHKNISIQGGAGSGKSVLCKKLVANKTNLVYARAERFLEETDINKIWGFDVGLTLKYLKDKPVVFFVDSLEFIADNRTKYDLLCALYEYTENYPTVKIITSCRTSDKASFLKIERKYSVNVYEVPDLSITEQQKIAEKYTVVKKMLDMRTYAALLTSPFYINLIISKITDIDNISDENQLRDYIWQDIICLKNNKTKEVIESIVFTRAKEFSLGAKIMEYDTPIIDDLLSKNILISSNGSVRLRYDIFEDICFEQYLDAEFNRCKGVYNKFYNEIESLGRCVYRRYQIWISNKLFAKINREKFLYELIFSDTIPQHWRRQTEIGLVKSRYCGDFFNDYGQAIIKNGMIKKFIKTTNLYAFEIDNTLEKIDSYIHLKPSGGGRQNLINIVLDFKLYQETEVSLHDIEKLCTDYSKVLIKDKHTAESACLVLTGIVDDYFLSGLETKDFSYISGEIIRLLEPIYRMAEYCSLWIKALFAKITSFYKEERREEKRLSEKIIKDTLDFKHIYLAKIMPVELCALAEMFWTFSPHEEKDRCGNTFHEREDEFYYYGLSEQAQNYEHGSNRSTALNSNFFLVLFQTNFWQALSWSIEFVNKAVLNLSKNSNENLLEYKIQFVEENTSKTYLGVPDMWLVTAQNGKMPMIISDLLFCLKTVLRSIIKSKLYTDGEIFEFAESVKKFIYEKSNNIASLTIITDIGMEFSEKLPGYTLDIVTNIHLVRNDTARFIFLEPNPIKQLLEKQIAMTIRMPENFLVDRYHRPNAENYELSYYIQVAQYSSDNKTKEKCYKILDYLYSIIPNDNENAGDYLQIQKMDLRTAKVEQIDDTAFTLTPTITGEAKKLVDEYQAKKSYEELASLINNCSEKISRNTLEIGDALKTIELIVKGKINEYEQANYDRFLVVLFVWILKHQQADNGVRAEICQMWIDRINVYFANGQFIFEYSLCNILFEQIETDVCASIKEQIKELIVELLIYDGNHGIIQDISRAAKSYLRTNKQLAQTVFNACVELAKDEMNHQKFNAKFNSGNSDTNRRKTFEKKYQTEKKKIINKFLFENASLDLSEFDMDDYDIKLMCYALNCGLSLNAPIFSGVVKKFFEALLDMWKENKGTYDAHGIINTDDLFQVMSFFQKELLENEANASTVLDIFFSGIDFSGFSHSAMVFYRDIFGALLADYFDAHSDRERRAKCMTIISMLEERVILVKEENIKNEFYKMLTLSMTNYGAGGDWSGCQSGYSYQDIRFLNRLFSQYGGFHLKELLGTIYKLHLNKLLPQILLSVRDAFRVGEADADKFAGIVREKKIVVLIMISKAFLDFSDEIKIDDDLTKAFEEILEILSELNYEEAATILDEFRVH